MTFYLDGGQGTTLSLTPQSRDARAVKQVGPLTAGTHTLTAVYLGDATHAGSSEQIELRVDAPKK